MTKSSLGLQQSHRFEQKPVQSSLGKTAKPSNIMRQDVCHAAGRAAQPGAPEPLCSILRMSSTDTALSALTLNFGLAFSACP